MILTDKVILTDKGNSSLTVLLSFPRIQCKEGPLFIYLWLHGMWNLSSPTRDWTCTPCIGSMESKSLEGQGSPKRDFSYLRPSLHLGHRPLSLSPPQGFCNIKCPPSAVSSTSQFRMAAAFKTCSVVSHLKQTKPVP